MSKQDQGDLLVNQTTAAIVICYLEYMETDITKRYLALTAPLLQDP
jgi:hypothetical protein